MIDENISESNKENTDVDRKTLYRKDWIQVENDWNDDT